MEEDSLGETGSNLLITFTEDNKDEELLNLIENLKTENQNLREQIISHSCLYEDKIKEFESAVYNRDEVIRQLENNLENCVQQKYKLEKDVECQAQEFNKEIEKLKESLLGRQNKSGSNLSEYYKELQTKLIQVQEKLAVTNNQLKMQTDASAQLEQKYKLLVKRHHITQETQLKERADYENKLEIINKQCFEKLNNMASKHTKELMELEENIRKASDKDLQNLKNSFAEQSKKLKLDYNLASSQIEHFKKLAEEQMATTEIEIQELNLKIKELNEQLSSADQDKEIQKLEWQNKMEELILDLRATHEMEVSNIKDLHKKEMCQISEQIDLLEKNHNADHSKIIESLSLLATSEQCLRDELNLEKSKYLDASIKLDEALKLVESLNESVQTLNASNKEILNEHKLKDELYNENIIKLNVKLTKSNDSILAKDKEIATLVADLNSEKKLKEELNSLLQLTSCQFDTSNKELLSMQLINDSLEKENKSLNEKIEECKNEFNLLNDQIKGFQDVVTMKSNLQVQVEKLQLKIIDTENLLSEYKQYKTKCHAFSNKIENLNNLITAYLGSDEIAQHIANDSEVYDKELQIFETYINILITKNFQSEALQKENELLDLRYKDSQHTNDITNVANTVIGNKENSLRQSNIDVSCQTLSSETFDQGLQTESLKTFEIGFQTNLPKDSSNLVATKTIEEDYVMEEIVIVPRAIKRIENVCKAIEASSNDSSDLIEFRKRYFDLKFVNRCLKNENLLLKKSLLDNNIMSDTSKRKESIGPSEIQLLSEVEDDVSNNDQQTIKSDLAYIETHLKLIDEKFQQQKLEMHNLDSIDQILVRTDVQNNSEDILKNIKNCDNENVSQNYIRIELLNLTKEKLNLLLTVQRLRVENHNLEEYINKNVIYKQQDFLLFSKNHEEICLEPENFREKILEAELSIQIIFNECLKEALQVKETTVDVSRENLIAQDYIRNGLNVLLHHSSKCFDMKKFADTVTSEWLNVIQEGSALQTFGEHSATDAASLGTSEALSLLHGIEGYLKTVLSQQKENRQILKDIEYNLITTLEKNFNTLKLKENDCSSNLPSLGCGSKLGIMLPSNFIPKEQGNVSLDDSQGSETDHVNSGEVSRSSLDDETHVQLLKEFDDITLSFINQAECEKVKILQSQKHLLLKILQDNQSKIAEICQNHVDKLNETSINDLSSVVDSLVKDVKETLVEETLVIENEYSEFLKQYTHEQSLHSQSHSLTFTELKERISNVLQNNVCHESRRDHNAEVRMKEMFSNYYSSGKFGEKVAMMSSLTDLETQKKIMNILTQITLNLLHYYSVSQNCADKHNPRHDDNLQIDSNYYDDNKYGLDSISPTKNNLNASEPCIYEQYHSLEPDEHIHLDPLDTTAASEGMLEDLEKDEQIKRVLSSSCPNLTAALKGKLDNISITELEKEVQEFIISLQASAGLLKIIMAQKYDLMNNSNSSLTVGRGFLPELSQHPNSLLSNTLTTESGFVPDLSQYPNSLLSNNESLSICRHEQSQLDCLQSLSYESINLNENKKAVDYKFEQVENSPQGNEQPKMNEEKLVLPEELNNFSSDVDASLDFTTLKATEVPKEKQMEAMREKLRELIDQRNVLNKKLHEEHGHLMGVLDQKKTIELENNRMEELTHKLCKELQETKDLLSNSEQLIKQLQESKSTSSPKKQSPREIKDKVRAILAAKDIEKLEQKELVIRVKELETVLDEVARSKEEFIDTLNVKVADLTQQLEVADRQLKQSRQFLDEQATERDQEFDILVKDNENLRNLLKEKESIANQHQNLLKEVSMLEKELSDKISKLDAAKQEREERESDLIRALDKVKDLRDIVQSVESQLNLKCLENQQLLDKFQSLTDDLKDEKKISLDLSVQLESMEHDRRSSKLTAFENPNVDYLVPSIERGNSIHGPHRQVTKSLSEELGTKPVEETYSDTQENIMFQSFADMLQRSTQMLVSMQVLNTSGSAVSDEEVSVREQLELSRNASMEESRSLSPSSLEQKLEEKFEAFEKVVEAAVKNSKDLEMRLKVAKTDYDELVSERDELHQKLLCLSNLKSELEQAATEYEHLKSDFDLHISKLKEELLETHKAVAVGKEEKSELERMNNLLTEEVKSLKHEKEKISADMAEILNHVSELEKKESEWKLSEIELLAKSKEFEIKILDLCTERDQLQKQNSEQLIKLSSTESRLEDFRRADSPQDYELKMRISSLKEELVKIREELTQKYRENEDLRYTMRDLKDKLILRDEELDRINQQNCAQPSSLPQTIVDQRLHQIHELKNEVLSQKEEIARLNDQIKEDTEKLSSKINISDSLLKHLLEQKNAEIDHIKSEFNMLKPISEAMMPLVNAGYSYNDIFESLKKGFEVSWQSEVDKTPEEIQRKDVEKTPEGIVSIMPLQLWEVQRDTFVGGNNSGGAFSEASYVSSNQPSNSSKLSLESMRQDNIDYHPVQGRDIGHISTEEDFLNEHTNASITDNLDEMLSSKEASLSKSIDDNSLLKEHIAILEKEIKGLTEYQKKLEEDFRSAQEMIEKKEDEIIMLTEEIEDTAPSNFPLAEIQIYQEKLDAEQLKSENLLIELDHCKEQNDLMRTDINYLQETIEYLKLKEAKVNQLEVELESFRHMEESLTKELDSVHKTEQNYVNKIKALEESQDELVIRENNLRKDLELLEKEHAEKQNLLSQQKATLQKKDQEVEELTMQIGHLLTQLKDTSTTNEKRLYHAQQKQSSLIQEMTEKNIEREKQLCNEYEERMASQVTDLSLKLSREKTELKAHYESLLSKALPKNDNTRKELCNVSQESKFIDKSDSVEDLQNKLRQELSNSAQLDKSLFSYLENDPNDPQRNTSHESSVLSDAGNNNNENDSVTHRIKMLMKKVYKEGVQVLTLTELMFLKSHNASSLGNELSLLSEVASPSSPTGTVSHNITQDPQGNFISHRADTQTEVSQMNLGNYGLSQLNEEIIKQKNELKIKARLLEYSLEHEKRFAQDYQEQLEAEKCETDNLRKQLNNEKSKTFNLTSELTQFKCQLSVLEKQFHSTQQELDSALSQLESQVQQKIELEEALLAERNNFSRVSTTLNHQRKLSENTSEQDHKIILDLRNTLEAERKRALSLVNQLYMARSRGEFSPSNNTTLRSSFNSNSSIIMEKELEAIFAMNRDIDLKVKQQETELILRTLKEQHSAEKAEFLEQLGESQVKLSQLQKKVSFYESEKEKLNKNLQVKESEIRQLKDLINQLQTDCSNLKKELSMLKATHNKDNKMVSQHHDEIKVKYFGTLEKLQNTDSEFSETKRKLAQYEYELLLAKNREEHLTRELEMQKDAVRRFGIPGVERFQNLNEYLELQQKENVRLRKTLSELNDDRRTLKHNNASLEARVVELNEQMNSCKSSSKEDGLNQRGVHTAEKAAFEAEKSSLQLALKQSETKNGFLYNCILELRAKLEQNQLKLSENATDTQSQASSIQYNKEEARLQYLCWKYSRSESYRKALVFQKKFILTLLEGFRKTESHTLKRLTSIVKEVQCYDVFKELSETVLSPSSKFKSVVLVIISIHRMKFLVKRWHPSRKLEVFAKTSFSCADTVPLRGILSPVSPAASPVDFGNRAPLSGVHMTGKTPPTKDCSKKVPTKRSQRNLFDSGDPSDFDEYITRVDHIHSTLGINSKKP